MLRIIKSYFFTALFVLWTGFLCVVLIPITFLGNRIATYAGRTWAYGIILMLKYICGITHSIEGIEKLPNKPCIIVSKHQSAWDTMIFFSFLPFPIFVLKQELLKIPLFGPFLTRMGMIPVNRKGGISAMKDMLANVKDRLSKGASIVIFPEGTRIEYGKTGKYNPGIAYIYQDKEVQADFVPIALNSGKCWPTGSVYKNPGHITLKILDPIRQGGDKKEFMKIAQERIEEACKEI